MAEETALSKILKSILPYISKDAAQAVSTAYGFGLPNTKYPTTATSKIRNYMNSSQRAIQALNSLNSLDSTTQETPGFKFLQSSLGLLKDYGGTQANGMSRSSFERMKNSFLQLRDETSKTSTGYGDIGNAAEYMILPEVMGNQVNPTTKINNTVVYGASNKKLFT